MTLIEPFLCRQLDISQEDGDGGDLPIMAYTGRLHSKGVPFSGFGTIISLKGVRISQMEVYENNREICHELVIVKSILLKFYQQMYLMTLLFNLLSTFYCGNFHFWRFLHDNTSPKYMKGVFFFN